MRSLVLPMASGDSGGLPSNPGSLFIRAFDKRSGGLIHAIEPPSKRTAPPMSYMLDGAQYIVVAVGTSRAREHPAEYVALT